MEEIGNDHIKSIIMKLLLESPSVALTPKDQNGSETKQFALSHLHFKIFCE